jgi:hypothetical protein
MSKSKRRPALMQLIRRIGTAGPARSHALQGISAPTRSRVRTWAHAGHIPPILVTLSGLLLIRYTAQVHTSFEVAYYFRLASPNGSGLHRGLGSIGGSGLYRATFTTSQKLVVSTLTVGVGAIGAFALPVTAQAEPAPQPWWHLLSVARPTYLHSGAAASEVQQLSAEPGTLFQLEVNKKAITPPPPNGHDGIFESEQRPANGGEGPVATHEELQKALEENVYGAGNVQVTGGPAGSGKPLTITSVGADSDQGVAPLEVSIAARGKTEAKVLTQGKPDGEIILTAADVGNADVTGAKVPVKLEVTLPKGLEAVGLSAGMPEGPELGSGLPLPCKLESSSGGTCTLEGATYELSGRIFQKVLPPFRQIEVHVPVAVQAGAHSGEEVTASVTGGEAPPDAIHRPVTIAPGTAPFGVESYELANEDVGGAGGGGGSGGSDLQAGSHPFQQTTTIAFNTATTSRPKGDYVAESAALPKDLNFKWPPGLIGDPSAFEHCTLVQFLHKTCPPKSILGVATTLVEGGDLSLVNLVKPLYNLEPAPGEAARLGFEPFGTPVYIDATVRSGEDYGVTVHVENTTQVIAFFSSEVTVWGVPGAASHDAQRGEGCLLQAVQASKGVIEGEHVAPCQPLEEKSPPPFLSLPTSCTGPSSTTVSSDSWLQPLPEAEQEVFPSEPVPPLNMPALDGCNRPPFKPEIAVKPDVQEASKPSGLTVDVHVPQSATLNAEGQAEADPRTITVALPAGVSVNPSSADGLQACTGNPGALAPGQLGSPGDQIGFKALEVLPSQPGRTAVFSSYLPGSILALAAGEHSALQPGVNFCPDASKIGEVEVKTPILPNPIKGFVYLASQEQNPFGSVLAMYIVAEENGKAGEPGSGSGVLVKLAGRVTLCKATGEVVDGLACEAAGQIVTIFENSPQAPFEDAILHFFGGERAPLTTPTRCGSYTTRAAFTPWTARENPTTGEIEPNQIVYVSSNPREFEIDSGPNGTPCPGEKLPFKPSMTGGATNVNAGAFSPLTATFSRLPGEQNLQSVELHLPPGLSGILANIELCPEPQANDGTCGPNSLIGETTVSVGVGGEPYTVSGGRFYLTGPYNGTGTCTVAPTDPGCAPFGLTFEVPAKAGPFDLARTAANHPACDCVLVRGKIEVNPYNTAITITSNTPGTPDAIPTSIEGIPLEIQHVNAITTRGDFQFNPTNCSKMEFSGTIHSSENGADTIGVPFQVTNCKALKFGPKFSVSTSAKTSKSLGASLTTKVVEPPEPQGSQANISTVKVELPKALPSRLTTLQKACTAAQFESNPAACPAASKIGYAKVTTPLIPVPLEGPAIFVSHGGEAFPSLTMVLQGYGITIDLVGSTYISKSGITSTTFKKTIDDQPFNTFELTLPEGPYSALAANGNLCDLTTTKTVKKQVTVKRHGKNVKVTRNVKETVPSPLQMPNEFIAQNGAEIHQVTPITVTGCGKSVKKSTKKHKQKKANHKGSK